MKKTDVAIMSQLRVDGRLPLTVLSKRTRLPVSTTHVRLKRMVEKGLVRPTLLLNFQKVGFQVRAFILLAIESKEKERLYVEVQCHPNVNSAFRINNGWSVLMDCVFKDMFALEDFVDMLESTFTVKQKQVHYVLDELKTESFFNDPVVAVRLMNEVAGANFK